MIILWTYFCFNFLVWAIVNLLHFLIEVFLKFFSFIQFLRWGLLWIISFIISLFLIQFLSLLLWQFLFRTTIHISISRLLIDLLVYPILINFLLFGLDLILLRIIRFFLVKLYFIFEFNFLILALNGDKCADFIKGNGNIIVALNEDLFYLFKWNLLLYKHFHKH